MGMWWHIGNPDAGPAGGEVIHRGDLQHRNRLALQLRHDAAAFTARRHRQTQHHAKARQQQHQQSIATSEAIESPATEVAREAFDLPGEGNQRQAHQQHRWKQPQPGGLKAGMKRMGQSQPEAEPHRQWQQQGVDADQQQPASPGRKANSSLSEFGRIGT